MSDLRPRGVPIVLDGEERHLLFTLNTIDVVQSEFGKTLDEVIRGIADGGTEKTDTMRTLLMILLNDEADRAQRKGETEKYRKITFQDAGELIGLDNYADVLIAIMKAYGVSLPEPDENDPNAKSGTANS